MSSFIYFTLIIVVAVLLARYNESNKLFWTLFVSLMLGMASYTFYHKISDKNDVKSSVQFNTSVEKINIPNLFDIQNTENNIVCNKTNKNKQYVQIVENISESYNKIICPPPEKTLLNYNKYYDTG